MPKIFCDDCLCYKAFRKQTECKRDCDEDSDDANESCDETPILPWTRTIQNEKRDNVYFDEDLPLHEHYEEYGCNIAKIKYPYSEDIAQQFYDRMQGEGDVYNLPKQLMPDICENMKCSKHNNEFSTEATDLVLVSKNTVIYRVLSDKILDVQVFARKTKQIPGEKRCQCLLQVDGHRWLLWHVGKGRMVDYAYLNFYLHQKVKGKGILEAWTTRNSAFESNNYQSSLMFKTFQKAAFGYENRLEFPPDAFICDDCTLSTKYIVFDGKVVGPKKHAIDH